MFMDIKKKNLSLVSYNHALTHGVVLSIPIAAKFIQDELGIDYISIGIPLTLSVMIYGLAGPIAGYMVDRSGAIKPMFIGMAVTTLSMLALSLSENLYWFSGWIVIAGFGLSFAHPSGLTLVSQLFHNKRGKAMGTFGFIGQFGQFIPPVVAGAIGTYYSWKFIFLVFFILYLLALAFCAYLLKSAFESEDVEKPISVEYRKALRVLLTGIVLLVLLLTMLRGNYYRAITTLLPFYSKDILDLEILTGAILLSIMLFSGLPGHLIGGWLADKYGPIKPLVFFTLTSIFGVLLCLSLNTFIFTAGLCIVGFSFFSAQPAENVLTANVSPLNVRGTLYGLKFVVSFGLSFVALIIIFVLADMISLIVAFPIILIVTVMAMFTVIIISRVYKGPIKTEESKPPKDEKWDFE
jgi:MFS family permease